MYKYYAVQRVSSDGWDLDGDSNFGVALQILHEYRMDGYAEAQIAVIENVFGYNYCTEEIIPPFTAEELNVCFPKEV